jgi:hypothetical protein
MNMKGNLRLEAFLRLLNTLEAPDADLTRSSAIGDSIRTAQGSDRDEGNGPMTNHF